MYFQHDGAPSHYTRHVMQHLNVTFPKRWIGRGSTINWPPRSPDLTPLDFCLWGLMKCEVYRKKVDTRDELPVNPLAWGHLNPSSYCDVARLVYGVFKLWSKLQRKK